MEVQSTSNKLYMFNVQLFGKFELYQVNTAMEIMTYQQYKSFFEPLCNFPHPTPDTPEVLSATLDYLYFLEFI